MDNVVERTLQSDPVMAELIDRYGPLRIEPATYPFQRLCVSIINQQLSSASATAIRERVFDLFDGPITPDALDTVEDAGLRDAGLSRTKVEYIRSAATAFQRHDLTRDGLNDRSDTDVIDELTEIPGVGEWTARMYCMFALGREDILPLGDLGVRRGFEQCYGDGEPMDRSTMRSIAEQWRPYRSYGTKYLWAEYESE